MKPLNHPYYVQVQIEASETIYFGEGNTQAEAIHCALYALPDAQIRTLQVWTLASSK